MLNLQTPQSCRTLTLARKRGEEDKNTHYNFLSSCCQKPDTLQYFFEVSFCLDRKYEVQWLVQDLNPSSNQALLVLAVLGPSKNRHMYFLLHRPIILIRKLREQSIWACGTSCLCVCVHVHACMCACVCLCVCFALTKPIPSQKAKIICLTSYANPCSLMLYHTRAHSKH